MHKKKKHLSNNTFRANKPVMNVESEIWDGDHSEKDSKVLSSCDNGNFQAERLDLLKKSLIKKSDHPASLKEKRIMSHDFTTRQTESKSNKPRIIPPV